jgi:hypothetical protein
MGRICDRYGSELRCMGSFGEDMLEKETTWKI